MLKQKQLIRFDWAMKRLLRSKANFGILEGFLSELLKRDLKIIEIAESESNKNHKENKFNKVDVLVKLDSGEIVLVEVQVADEVDFFFRMLFSTSKIITEHLKEGSEYSEIKKVYSVNILYFDLGHGTDYIYHGTTSFIGLNNHDVLKLSTKQKNVYQKELIHQIYPEYYLIKVNQFNDIAKNTLDEWIYFLKNEAIEDNFHAKGLAEAKEKLDSLKLPEKERREYERYLENVRYQNSMLGSSFKSGMVDGIAIGEARGEMKAKKASVLKMYSKNVKAEDIADFVNLSLVDVKAIISEN